MIRLFAGRENLDKEKFVYENIEGEAVVIVPDQYTVVSEEQAIKYTGDTCLFDIEIFGMNRLGLRILREKGMENMDALDKYGRHLILTRIINEKSGELDIFKKSAKMPAFIQMINDFISDCKRQNISPSDLKETFRDEGIDNLLKGKLREIINIYEEYEKEISGKYNDNEDYISKYVESISESKFIKNKAVWIYGFDSITPKFLSAIIELAKYSRGVNIIINESNFGLDGIMTSMIMKSADMNGVPYEYQKIGSEYLLEKSFDISKIEEVLFSKNALYDGRKIGTKGGIKIVESANPYYEAENAAAYIVKLIRDEGYRLKDIAIIANEEKEMQSIIKRTFSEYGLDVFSDSRDKITGNPAVIFVISLLKSVKSGINTAEIINILKSGISGFSEDEVLLMDSYLHKYRIRGNAWRKPFKYGDFEYGDEFKIIIDIERRIYEKLEKLENIIENAQNVEKFISDFSTYLDEEWNYTDNVKDMIENLEDSGNNSGAQIVGGSYEAIYKVLDQIKVIMRDDEFDIKSFIELYETGIVEVEIANIPPARDQLPVGTLIRTRPANIKAVVILGANEGILPLSKEPEGLFSIDEKKYFKKKEIKLGTLDDIKELEEKVALYRIISKPSERLYISYSLSSISGEDRKASTFVNEICDLFDIEVEKDIVTRGFSLDLVQGRQESLRHMMNYLNNRAMPDKNKEEERDMISSSLLAWYEKNEPITAKTLRAVASSDNKMKNLNSSLITSLYGRKNKDMVLSASKMERFKYCPFRYFISYGIKPKEDREFCSDSRDIGNVFHECIMQVSRKLMDEREKFGEKMCVPPNKMNELKIINEEIPENGRANENERANENNGILENKGINEIDTRELVHEELINISESHRGGIFSSDKSEEYRLSRIEDLCTKAVKELMKQLLDDELMEAFFEEPFSNRKGARFKPIELEVDDRKVYVEGKIDRVDYLKEDGVRVVDYKTGKEKVSIDKMKGGYKIQLMVYLESVIDEKHTPDGIFYFNISDELTELTDISKDKEQDTIQKNKDKIMLDGLYVDGENGGKSYASSKGISEEEFKEIRESVKIAMRDIAKKIIDGDISITPVKTTNSTECTYCDYKAICKFDISNDGNEYNYI